MPPEVLAALAQHRAEVGAMLNSITDEVLAAWVKAWSEIETELLRPWPEDPTMRRYRLETARQRASRAILEASNATGTRLTANARYMVERGMWEQPYLIEPQLPPGIRTTITRPAGLEVDRMVRRVQQQVTARAYYLGEDATRAMKNALTLGTAAGDNPREVARAMVRAAEGPFNGGVARAQVIARTEMIDAHRGAAQAAQDANADVLAGWRWWTELDPRTCPSCIEQHGKLHPLDEDGPLDHHQGRCARMPVTKTWAELGFTGIDDTRPPVESGRDWFDRQPESVQRDILGPQRFEAWQAGEFPMDDWSVRKSTDGWRDAYHVGKPGQGDAGTPAGPKPLRDMDDTELEARMMEAMESGDYALAEAAGAELDSRFYSGDGTRIDPANPHTPTVYDWYEQQDAATQQRYFDALSEHHQMTFHEAQWSHITGRTARRRDLPTLRERRKEFDDWLDQEWVKAEAATNGSMLSRSARAKGVEVTDLWKVNAKTARAWASDEMLEYWDTHGRMTISDWLASYTGGAETTATLNAGRWMR